MQFMVHSFKKHVGAFFHPAVREAATTEQAGGSSKSKPMAADTRIYFQGRLWVVLRDNANGIVIDK